MANIKELYLLPKYFVMKKILLLTGLILAFVACTRQDDALPEQLVQTKEITIKATREGLATKTELHSGSDVYWCPGDSLSLFFRNGDNGGSKFKAQNTEAVPIAEFKGTIDVVSGGGESSGGEYWFWGIYPYSTHNSCDGNTITTVIPHEQVGKAGSFANNTFITMARAKGLNLAFYNICSGVKFTLTRDDIKEVKIRGNKGEDIAGKIKAEWDDNGKPSIKEYVEGEKEVSVTAPGGGTFATGITYYLVLAPQHFTEGFTMSLTTSDDKQGYFVYENERQFNRSVFINISNLDERVSSWIDVATKELPEEGGTVELEYVATEPCEAVIPVEAQSWISVAPETKTTSNNSISLIVQPNIGLSRSATVKIVTKSNTSNVVLAYTITQDVGGVWKEGTIPPDNEIWYTTKTNSILNLEESYPTYNSKPFDSNVISHTYENGKGIIKCDGPITIINDHVFGNSVGPKINHLFLPNSITTLKCGALRGIDVEELRIPDNLQFVDGYAINSRSIKCFTGKHTSDDGRCVIIEEGYMPDFGNTQIPVQNYMAAFAPSGISTYELPSNVKILGWYAFRGANLKEISFNNELERICGDCFFEANLECNIIIPNNTELYGGNPFTNCSGIRGFYGNKKYCSEDHYCLIINNEIVKFVGYDITDYVIPNGIVGIRGDGFRNMVNLHSVTFPDSMLDVASSMFEGCTNLEYLFGKCVSEDCKGIIINNEFKSLVLHKGIKEYVVQDGVRSIGWGAFSELPELEVITIPDCVTDIAAYAFSWCSNLKKVVLSSHLERINYYNPFLGSPNIEEIYFRSYLPPAYSDTQFYEYECSNLTVYVPEETLNLYKKSGWYQYAPYMKGYKYDDIGEWNPDYYISTDYTADGTVTTLQQATTGAGINVILMGDAFSDRQIADGTYSNVMQKAMNALFSEEPYKSFKNYFNVYSVNVVSATEGYGHSGQALSTDHGSGTYVYGNDNKVVEYAKKAISEDKIDDALIIVMMNEDAYAGTCFMYYCSDGDYGRGLSIAYFPTSSNAETFNGLVSHEAGGHGFAKLADEYAYQDMGAIPAGEITNRKTMEPYGWWKNVDFTNDPAQVKWSSFVSDNRYTNEHIGCYEGGLTYWTGVWRPTENSIMRYNVGGFNAPSRYAIWYRIGKLAYGSNWNGTYEDFVTYDAVNISAAAIASNAAQVKKLKKPLPPLHAPVVRGYNWRDMKKMEQKKDERNKK